MVDTIAKRLRRGATTDASAAYRGAPAASRHSAGKMPNADHLINSKPVIDIFNRCARPLAAPDSVGCFYRGLRLVAIDGSDVDVDDCPENSDYFGRSKNQHGEGAYPKAKLVGLVEIGTLAAFALKVGKYRDSENELAMDVIPKLTPGMLCLADQLFMSFEIFDQVLHHDQSHGRL